MAMQHRGSLVTALRRLVGPSSLLLAGLLLFAPRLQAQVPGGMMNMSPEERAAQRISLLADSLDLNAAQTEQLKPLLVKQFTEQVAVMQKYRGGGDRAAMMSEMMTLRTRYDEEIGAVLTAPQKARYQEMVAAERARRMGRGGPR